MVYPVGPDSSFAYGAISKGGLSPQQQKQIDEIIQLLRQASSPQTEAIRKIHDLLASKPTLSMSAQNVLNQAIEQIKLGEVSEQAIATLENL